MVTVNPQALSRAVAAPLIHSREGGNPVTDHLDLWTSALLTKSTAGRGSNGKLEAYGIKKLRELILELAVRGKLVPQDPSDEPTSELLKKIVAEEAEPIRAGKTKKKRSPAGANDKEMQFTLPKSWTWIRLGNLAEILDSQRKPITKTDRNAGQYPYYGASGVVDYVAEYIFDEPLVLVGEDGAKWGRGDSTAFSISGKTWVNNHAHVLRPNRRCILDSYLVYFLTATDLSKYITGMTVPKLNQARLVSIPVSLPPLAEQHRIVAKVDELMALCDQLEQQQTDSLAAHQTLVETLLGTLTRVESQQEFSAAWARIASHFDTLFTTEASIDQLKQTILQLAVMGKLVPQDPNDEPASVLLGKIAGEKERLIREGLLKKEKPLLPLTDEEMAFPLPHGWAWAKFGVMAEFINGDRSKNYPNRSEYVDEGVAWINTGHIEPNGRLTTHDMNFISRDKFDSLNSGKIHKGDLVYCLRGATFGKTALVDPYEEGAIASSLMIIRPFITDLNKYIFKYLVSPFGKQQLFRFDNGSAQPNLSAGNVMLYAFPLPPLAEQHRIVAKVDELMALCDALKARLADAQTTQLHLADAIVEQAVC